MEKNESIGIRVERRGYSEELSSKKLEEEIGQKIVNYIKEMNNETPEVDLEDPDVAIFYETLGDWAGVSVIKKEVRERTGYMKWQ